MNYLFLKKRKEGFTLVEIMVVISIVIILFGIVVASIMQARASTRDKVRAADLAKIELALRLFVEKNQAQDGGEIDCINGLKIDGRTVVETVPAGGSCADGAAILSFLSSQYTSVPKDPLGGGDADYYYYFDIKHDCDPYGERSIIFAANLEKSTTNAADICPPTSANNEGGYYSTTPSGGSKSKSAPYVKVITFAF